MNTVKITHLPYMGKPTDLPQSKAVMRKVPKDTEFFEPGKGLFPNPEEILIAKIEGLAKLLGCSEQRAEVLIFTRIDKIHDELLEHLGQIIED